MLPDISGDVAVSGDATEHEPPVGLFLIAHAAIRLWLATDRLQVVISVWDASPEPPSV